MLKHILRQDPDMVMVETATATAESPRRRR
jgi:type II secretory ATPase GspE/PulE/Tfp pilus assembly ATPase PilB-like protein